MTTTSLLENIEQIGSVKLDYEQLKHIVKPIHDPLFERQTTTTYQIYNHIPNLSS